MKNEFIFFAHSVLTTIASIGALVGGREALTTLIAVYCIIANLFVTKQIVLFSFSVTPTDAYIVGSVISLNLLQEYFGSQPVKVSIRINLFVLSFFLIAAFFQLVYDPAPFDQTESSFSRLLFPQFWIITASAFVFFIVQNVDSRIFRFLKNNYPGHSLAWRNCISVLISQFLDTLLFTLLGLSFFVENVWHIIFVSYMVKLLSILISVPLITLLQRMNIKKVSV